MKKIDFEKIPIKDIDGNVLPCDVRKVVGNTLFNMADDVAEWELGVKIYNSVGEVEISEKDVQIIMKFAGFFKYVLRHALTDAMKG